MSYAHGMAQVGHMASGGRAVLLGLLSLALASAGGCSGKRTSSGIPAGMAAASAGDGGTLPQAVGGNPSSAGTTTAGGVDQIEAGTGGVTPAGAPAEAGQPSTAEGGAAGQPPDWPTGIVNEFGFALEDSWLLMPCLELSPDPHFCSTVLGECPNQDTADLEQRGYRFIETFELGGELGVSYDVTLRINGIAEAKYYEGGQRRAGNEIGNVQAAAGSDTWHTGGQPTAGSFAIYKLTVFEPDGVTEVQHYYLNSFHQASGAQAHFTVPLGYEATITVPGQGFVEYLSVEPDCYTNNNCGPGDSINTCNAPRQVPNEPGLLLPKTFGGQPLASLNVMTGDQQPFHAHIIHVTVIDVVAK